MGFDATGFGLVTRGWKPVICKLISLLFLLKIEIMKVPTQYNFYDHLIQMYMEHTVVLIKVPFHKGSHSLLGATVLAR